MVRFINNLIIIDFFDHSTIVLDKNIAILIVLYKNSFSSIFKSVNTPFQV